MKNLISLFKQSLFKHYGGLSPTQLEHFLLHTGNLLTSGVPIKDALHIVVCSKKNTQLKEVAQELLHSIMRGESFEQSIEKILTIPHSISITLKAGTQTGALGQAMLDAATILHKQAKHKQTINMTLQKPLFTLSACVAIFFIAAIFVAPSLAHLFTTLNAPQPRSLRTIIWIGRNWAGIILSVLVMLLLFRFISHRYPQVAPLRLIGIRQHQTTIALFIFLKNLINHGQPLLNALDLLKDEFESHEKIALEKVKFDILAGAPLAAALSNLEAMGLDAQDLGLIDFSNQSSNLLTGFDLIITKHETELQATLKKIEVLLGPIIMFFIGGIVLMTVVSLYKPLISLGTLIKIS